MTDAAPNTATPSATDPGGRSGPPESASQPEGGNSPPSTAGPPSGASNEQTVTIDGKQFRLTPVEDTPRAPNGQFSAQPANGTGEPNGAVTAESINAVVGLLSALGIKLAPPEGFLAHQGSQRMNPPKGPQLPGDAGKPNGAHENAPLTRESVQAMSPAQINANWERISAALKAGQLAVK